MRECRNRQGKVQSLSGKNQAKKSMVSPYYAQEGRLSSTFLHPPPKVLWKAEPQPPRIQALKETYPSTLHTGFLGRFPTFPYSGQASNCKGRTSKVLISASPGRKVDYGMRRGEPESTLKRFGVCGILRRRDGIIK